MKSWQTPTAEQLQKLAAMALKPESRAYFFDRLDNPSWVGPLAELGFFADPPAPEPAGEPGYVRFPPWPEARYLERIAAQAPDDVVNVLRDAAQSDNPSVTRQMLAVANALPDDHFRSVVDRVSNWLDGPQAELFADEASTSIVRMFELEEIANGLVATSVLLALVPDPRLSEKAAKSDSPYRPRPEAQARMSEWNYQRVLDEISGPMADHGRLGGLDLLSSLVDEVLSLSRWADENTEDYSVVWRPAIEDHEQNSGHDIRNALISATRDVAVRLATRSPVETAQVVDELRGRSIVNQRIGIYVVATVGGDQTLVSDFVGNREFFDDHHFKHEYSCLLERRFDEASAGAQAQVLRWIEDGPDLDAYRRRSEAFDGAQPSDDQVALYARVWRRDWLSFVEDYLDESTTGHYRALVDELGAAEHAGFLSWSTSWSGPESPFTSDDLQARDPQDVIELLCSWMPAGRPVFGASIEGLGRTFAEVVKTRAVEYASVAGNLTVLDPTYVRAYFSGLGGALREGASIEWGPTVALAAFGAGQEFEPDEEAPDRDRDPGWRWCRREISSLLQIGFAKSEHRIPFLHREAVWSIIGRLTNDPNPSPAHEDRYGGENMDPLTLSLNTNRGEAMHAVVEYALWVRRGLESEAKDVSAGFDAMPEVVEVLDRHLDIETELSLAVRAVYGRWLPWLHLLDASWVSSRVGLLLPEQPELAAFRDATWSTYVSWCPPFDSVFLALRRDYELAVRRVPSIAETSRRRHNPDAKLGEHLVTLYWRGLVEAELLDEYFSRAGDELTGEVLEFVGRALRNTEGVLADGVRLQIERLWARRLDLAEGAPDQHRAQARSFGVSFSAGKLTPAWALVALERFVAIGGSPVLSSLVVESLVDVARSQPGVSARIVASMLAQSEEAWDYLVWKEQAREIVSLAMAAEDDNVAEYCHEIVDFFVKRGDLEFRDLLRF